MGSKNGEYVGYGLCCWHKRVFKFHAGRTWGLHHEVEPTDFKWKPSKHQNGLIPCARCRIMVFAGNNNIVSHLLTKIRKIFKCVEKRYVKDHGLWCKVSHVTCMSVVLQEIPTCSISHMSLFRSLENPWSRGMCEGSDNGRVQDKNPYRGEKTKLSCKFGKYNISDVGCGEWVFWRSDRYFHPSPRQREIQTKKMTKGDIQENGSTNIKGESWCASLRRHYWLIFFMNIFSCNFFVWLISSWKHIPFRKFECGVGKT